MTESVANHYCAATVVIGAVMPPAARGPSVPAGVPTPTAGHVGKHVASVPERTDMMPPTGLRHPAKWLSIAALVVLAALVWGRTARFDFVWDDEQFVVTNPAIRSVAHLPGYFTDIETMAGQGMGTDFAVFRPLRNLSYLLDFYIAGLNPSWWHVHNVLLHLLNALLVFVVARRLVGGRLAPFAAAALFLVHPVQTETVAWIKCRDDLLAAAFVLIGLHLWLRWRDTRPSVVKVLPLAAVGLLACLSKVQAVMLPVLIGVAAYWLPDSKPRTTVDHDNRAARRPFTTATVAAMGLVVVAVLLWRHAFIGRTEQTGYIAGSFAATMLTMTRAAVRYLGLLVWPRLLVADYSGMAPSHALFDWRVLVSIAVIVALAGAVVRYRSRFPVVTFGLLWFGLCLAPVSNLVPMMQYMAERFLYVPLIGVALTFGALVERLAARRPRTAAAFALAVIIALSARSAFRVGAWKDAYTIFNVTVRDTPERALRPRRNLLSLLINTGRYARALPLAETLWETWGHDKTVRPRWRAEYARHLGFILLQRDDEAAGRRLIRRAIAIDPTYSTPYVDLGVLAGKQRDHAAALELFRKAVDADPNDPGARFNLGIALRELGRPAEAETALRGAIAAGAAAPGPYKSLAALLWSQNRIPEAVAVYAQAKRLWPEDEEISRWHARGIGTTR